MKRIKSLTSLVAGVIISFAACKYSGNDADSSALSDGTPSGAGSAESGVATENKTNATNLSLTDTLFRSDSSSRDTTIH